MASRVIKKILQISVTLILIVSCNQKKNDQFLGVISSATPEASKVGELIFNKGGNAVDAAIAISFALGVTEPAMSGLGGGTQVLLSVKNAPPIAINGTTFSPKNLPQITRDTLTFHRRSTIPSTVKVLDYLFKNFSSGNLSWKELIGPAIELAENGFKVGPFRAKVYKKYEDKLLSSRHNTSLFLSEGNEIPRQGERIKQPILAKTLKRLAIYGADDFYKGKIAEDIAHDMKENGGWITLKDLNNFKYPNELKPLSVTYNDHQIFSQPPPCGGWVNLLIINISKHKKYKGQIPLNELIDALYLGHYDRRNSPITNLSNYQSSIEKKLSDSYAKGLLVDINKDYVEEIEKEKGGETTHFSVVDSEGSTISVTSSINAYFGALAASERLGFLYNTYMDDFIFDDENHPFAVSPQAMAYSSMSPTIIQKNEENVLVIGSPGSSRIISTVAQLSVKWIHGDQLEDLIKSSRVHVNQNNVLLERKADSIAVNEQLLSKYNLTIKFPDESLIMNNSLNPYFGGVHAIAKEDGKWIGVADPRRDGKALHIYRNEY